MLENSEFEQAMRLVVYILDAIDRDFIIQSADGGNVINTGLVDLVVLNVYIALASRVPGLDTTNLTAGLRDPIGLEHANEISAVLWEKVLTKREVKRVNS